MDIPLLHLLKLSDNEAVQQYLKFEEMNRILIYMEIFKSLRVAIETNNEANFKKLSHLLALLNDASEIPDMLKYFQSQNTAFNLPNVIIIASKYNRVEILNNIFSDSCTIIDDLFLRVSGALPFPADTDEECHNAFYYALRSGNKNLLEVLVKKWPGDYFSSRPVELYSILSKSYYELKLKNVDISLEMQIFVHSTLLDLYFENKLFNTPVVYSHDDISERISLISDCYNMIKEAENYPGSESETIFLAKQACLNIFILKKWLKSTYDRIPWEEMEYHLISYVRHLNHQGNYHSCFVLRTDLVAYLGNFIDCLMKETNHVGNMSLKNLSAIRYKKRDYVVKCITKNYPSLEDFYRNHELIRDSESLNIIKKYIDIASEVNPREKSGQTVIIRALQVMGENLKNTLESPKLSSATSNYLMSFLPPETNKILIALRNSFSHGFPLFKCKEMIEIYGAEFYVSVQKDLKNIHHGITSVLNEIKFKSIIALLERICNCEDIDRLREIFQMLRISCIQDRLSRDLLTNTSTSELEKLIFEFKKILTGKTHFEENLFHKIDEIMNSNKNSFENLQLMYQKLIATLAPIHASDSNIDDYGIFVFQKLTGRALDYLIPQMKSEKLKEVGTLSGEILKNVQHRINKDDLFTLCCLIQKIYYVSGNGQQEAQYLCELRDSYLKHNSEQIKHTVESNHISSVQVDMTALKQLIDKHKLSETQIATFISFKNNITLQAEVEMLVLSILSGLKNSKSYLVTNQISLDSEYPLLVSKELRNHLAHGNALGDILVNIVQSLFLFAVKLTKQDVRKKRKKSWVKQAIENSNAQSQFKYISYLKIQNKFFLSLSSGSIEEMALWVRKGGDVYGRDNNSMTTLHYAAQSSNLEILLTLNNYGIDYKAKDFHNRSILHIAAASGSKDIVDYLIRNLAMPVNEVCYKNNTPLHLAVENDCYEVVETLLYHKAKTCVRDALFMTPLHRAVFYSRVKIAKLFLRDVKNVNLVRIHGGFTLLHTASEKGSLELVLYFIDKGVDVNSVTSERRSTPLHLSAFFGHLEIVKALLSNGANIHARNVENQTALHKAVEKGHSDIVKFLLYKGADSNALDDGQYSPLHFAIREKHINALKILLEHDVNSKYIAWNGASILEYAVYNGDIDIVNYLIENCSPFKTIRSDGFSLLHVSIIRGSNVILKRLIQYGEDINCRDRHGQTPLSLAIKSGNLTAVTLLLQSGADVFSTHDEGYSLLHVCASVPLRNIEIIVFYPSKIEIPRKTIDNNKTIRTSNTDRLNIFKILVTKGADVEKTNNSKQTPLHIACKVGNVEIVRYLFDISTNIGVADDAGYTPLHYAAEGDHFECVKLIIENSRSSINSVTSYGDTALCIASKRNCTENVRLLIRNGADINAGDPLYKAIQCSSQDVCQILLQRKGTDVKKQFNGKHDSLLQLAAAKGLKIVISAFLANKVTLRTKLNGDLEKCLAFAISNGYDDIVTLLIDNGADINKSCKCSSCPLHIAVAQGHYRTVEILLNKGVDINILDNENRRPIEFAASSNRLDIMKLIYKTRNINLNVPGNGDFTLLHIAANFGNLDIVKFLIDEGASTNFPNSSGSKPIHIAARDGHLHILKYLINHNKINLKERSCSNKTLLHYAAQSGRPDIVKYLIEKKLDVNDRDDDGVTPLHVASVFGFEDVMKVLLDNGAIYNRTDILIPTTELSNVVNTNVKLLSRITILFQSVKKNDVTRIKSLIKEGVCVNAKNSKKISPLHYAAWKGYNEIVKILLENNGNPNSLSGEGYTPLHYACKFNNFEIVKSLLESGAVYNVLSKTKKVPLELTQNHDIIKLLKLIDDSFRNVNEGSCEVLKNLKTSLSSNIIKATFNAKNRKKKTLLTSAICCDFPFITELQRLICKDSELVNFVSGECKAREQYDTALKLETELLKKKEQILDSENPAVLETKENIATTLYKQQKHSEALDICKDVLKIKETNFGKNHAETLKTRGFIALILHRLERNSEAIKILEDLYPKLEQMFGLNNFDVLQTLSDMALVLNGLGRHEEALKANKTVFERFSKLHGANDYRTLISQNNIGQTLLLSRKYDEAIPFFKSVYESRKILLGESHSDTCRVLYNLNTALCFQTKSDEALKGLQEVLSRQEETLGWNHVDTLDTESQLGILLMEHCKHLEAIKVLKKNVQKRKAVFGADHPSVLHINRLVDVLNTSLSIASPESLSSLNNKN